MGLAAFGLSLGGCGREQRIPEGHFAKFTADGNSELQGKIKTAVAKWHLDKMKQYDLDQTKGILCFTDDSGQRVSCSVQIVGTFSTESQTWLWSWASPWV